jgi:hypothetical protein
MIDRWIEPILDRINKRATRLNDQKAQLYYRATQNY